ncbi:MAG: tetratricopeptide repeat protein [Paraclostridium bifermentans]|nr:tetratricopeptide repeat protein [Paraclostridium bifermentans]
MSGIFLKRFLKRNNKVLGGGYISYYGLTDWWNELSDEERKIIRNTYNPMSSSEEDTTIDKGDISYCSGSKLGFIGGLVDWFEKEEKYNIALKIIQLGEDNINETEDILDLHFFYLNCIKVFYRNRDNYLESLEKAIEYCEKQISISKKSKRAWICEYSEELPFHTGYDQLAIIYEKKKDYDKALAITRQALKEGWNNDCQKRIDRLIKKINKENQKEQC